MKHTIEIDGLPEGWEAVAYRHPKIDEHVLLEGKIIKAEQVNMNYEQLIVKKKQPRRIVLEETGRNSSNIKAGEFGLSADGSFYRCTKPSNWGSEYSVWREVKESDLSLNNEEPKLSLSVDECRNMSLSEINMKIVDFLKDK